VTTRKSWWKTPTLMMRSHYLKMKMASHI
jgi:hypothetical protein